MDSFCHYLDTLVTASFSIVGAFIPTFILMYVHYLVRKSNYKERKQRLDIIIDVYRSMVKTNDEAIQAVYKSMDVNDYPSLLKKLKGDKEVSVSQCLESAEFIRKNFDQKRENQEKLRFMMLLLTLNV